MKYFMLIAIALIIFTAPIFGQDEFKLKVKTDTLSFYITYVNPMGLITFDSIRVIRTGVGNDMFAGYFYNIDQVQTKQEFFDGRPANVRITQYWKKDL